MKKTDFFQFLMQNIWLYEKKALYLQNENNMIFIYRVFNTYNNFLKKGILI